jgi:hypothetical protein
MKTKLLNRTPHRQYIDDKCTRIKLLKKRLLYLVQTRQRTPYTQEQWFRLTRLENFYYKEMLLGLLKKCY